MSVLGRAYLGVSLILFILGLIWFSLVLQENRAWDEVVLLVPRFDVVDPLVRKRIKVSVAALLAGWGGGVGLLLLLAMRAPFRIRSTAVLQRRLRELEREILELRTLPLRQQEEDEILAAEAHLDIRAKKVMTEKLRRDRMLAQDAAEASSPARPLVELGVDESGVVLGADVGFRPPSLATQVASPGPEGRR
ncbi:hypothetical protein ACNOYE_39595 [Nannocystaceae bacterium ST9]